MIVHVRKPSRSSSKTNRFIFNHFSNHHIRQQRIMSKRKKKLTNQKNSANFLKSTMTDRWAEVSQFSKIDHDGKVSGNRHISCFALPSLPSYLFAYNLILITVLSSLTFLTHLPFLAHLPSLNLSRSTPLTFPLYPRGRIFFPPTPTKNIEMFRRCFRIAKQECG